MGVGLRGKNRHLTSGSGDGQIDIYIMFPFSHRVFHLPPISSSSPSPPTPTSALSSFLIRTQKYGCKSVKQATLASEDDKLAGTAK